MSKSISDKSILGALTVNDKNVPVISYSDTTPTSPAVGDLWFNTSNGYTYLYYNDGSSSQWVSISNSGAGAQGVVSATSPLSYNSSTQNISLSTVPVSSGGTGATDAASARTSLGAAASSSPTISGTINAEWISASQRVIGTTPNDSGSTGGLAVKAPAGGSQTSAYLQVVNNAYNAQLGAISTDPSSVMTVSANRLNLPSVTHQPGSVVGFNRIRTTARSAYGYNGDVILSDLNISITPKFSNSLLLVQWQIMYESDYNSVFRVYRDNGLVYTSGYQGYNENDGNGYSGVASLMYDTDVASTPNSQMIQYFVPAGSTNTTTLQLAVRSSYNTGATFYLNRSVNSGGSNAYEIGVSTAVIWEIAQ